MKKFQLSLVVTILLASQFTFQEVSAQVVTPCSDAVVMPNVMGDGWQQSSSGGILPTFTVSQTVQHKVQIALSDGTVDTFSTILNPFSNQITPLVFTSIVFTPDVGTQGLLVPFGGGSVQVDPPSIGVVQLLDSQGNPFDPQMYLYTVDGNTFTLSKSTDQNSLICDDLDSDGVPNDQDVCPGFDDNMDTDSDGIPDGCDENPTLSCGAGTVEQNHQCFPDGSQGKTCGEGTKMDGNECVADLDAICGQGTTISNMMCVVSLAIGGYFVGIEHSSLLISATQLTAAWMIPVIVAAIGIGIVILRKF